MAGSARYTAVLDANVLYPMLVRDILLSLAVAGLYHARWTSEIQAEWVGTALLKQPGTEDRLKALAEQMNRAVPDSLVENYDRFVAVVELPDAADRHVVAAAIAGHADAIVTFNMKDFPQEALAPFAIEVQHPDEFVMNQLQLQKLPALGAVKAMRARWKNPPRSPREMIAALEKRGLPLTADMLREAEDLI